MRIDSANRSNTLQAQAIFSLKQTVGRAETQGAANTGILNKT